MSIALAQSSLGTHTSFAYTNAGATSPITCTVGSTTTAGSLLVILVYWHNTGATPPATGGAGFPTGGSGLTWRQSGAGGFNSGGDRASTEIFYAGNAPSQSGGTVFTLSGTAGNGFGAGTSKYECVFYEFTGIVASTSSGILENASATISTQTASTPHTANLTTTKTDLILVSFIGTGTSITAGSGYTLGIDAGNVTGIGQLQYALNVAPGSIATAFNGSQALWGGFAVAFAPIPATGGASYGFFFG
jgi:hypothetical protein